MVDSGSKDRSSSEVGKSRSCCGYGYPNGRATWCTLWSGGCQQGIWIDFEARNGISWNTFGRDRLGGL